MKGGPIESITIQGRTFAVAQDSDPDRVLGGKQNSIEANGDGSVRVIQEQVPSKIDGIAIVIDDDRGDQEFIQDLKDQGELVDVSVTYVTGSVYYGSMAVVDASKYSPKKATMEIHLAGKKLTKQ